MQSNGKGMVILCVYVDDILVVSDKEVVVKFTNELMNETEFKVEKSGELTEFSEQAVRA